MSNGNLKQIVCEHIESQSLSEKQMNSLLQMQKEGVEKTEQGFKLSARWVAMAAVFFIALGNVMYFSLSVDMTLEERIGSEVAKNHINLKPLEITTSNISTIRDFLTKLDFMPVESVLLRGSTKSLIGGRYCSIQGVTAAQLRLKDSKTGQIQSLYQAVYDREVFHNLPLLKENQNPVTVYSKGLAVDIWVEKGILFALTKDSNRE